MRDIDSFIERISPSFEDKVVAYAPALLPTYLVRIELLVRMRTEVGAAEWAMLQAIEAGLVSPRDVEGFLGLDSRYFRQLLVSLEQQSMLSELGQPSVLLLTERGRQAIAEGKTEEDRIEELRIHFDPLLRRVFAPTPYPAHHSEFGPMVLLGERMSVPPMDSEMEPAEIQNSFGSAGMRREWGGRQILRITSVLEKKIRYQQVTAIVLRNAVSGALSLRIAVGGQMMEERGRALNGQQDPKLDACFAECNPGGEQERFEILLEKRLPASYVGATKRLKKELINAKVRRAPIARQYDENPTSEHEHALERIDAEIAGIESQAAIAPDVVQTGLAVHKLIQRAFVEARSHILVVVPGQLIDFPREYLQLALAANTAGVSVTIAHSRGATGVEEPVVKTAMRDLKRLAKTVYWETSDGTEPLFIITWDSRCLLLINRAPFALLGSAQQLVPTCGAHAEHRDIVTHLFPDATSAVRRWAMTARRVKSFRSGSTLGRQTLKRKENPQERDKRELRKQHKKRKSSRRTAK